MATILDGKALAAKCKEAVKAAAQSLARKPGLAVIIVGNNPASRVYVNSKRKDCEECGFLSEEYALPEETTQAELIALIEELNGRDDIDGILCQLPLPQGIDEERSPKRSGKRPAVPSWEASAPPWMPRGVWRSIGSTALSLGQTSRRKRWRRKSTGSPWTRWWKPLRRFSWTASTPCGERRANP